MTFLQRVEAAAGDLDLTFGSGGYTTTDLGGDGSENSIAIQGDGRILIVGGVGEFGASLATVRYNTNGSLDTSFGNAGVVSMNVAGTVFYTDVLVQADGKILVTCDRRTVRFNANGTLDATFASAGITTVGGRALALQNDGKILVAGGLTIQRLNQNGSLDPSFGVSGQASTSVSVSAMQVQADGKIVVAGAVYKPPPTIDVNIGLMRFNVSGILDSTFADSGISVIAPSEIPDVANDLKIQPDGKMVIAGAGFGYNRVLVIRCETNGRLDSSFGNNGINTIPNMNVVGEGTGVVFEPDGKIVVAGRGHQGGQSSFISARFNRNGSIDSTYGRGRGFVLTDMGNSASGTDAALQPDGKLVIAGYRDNNPSGSSSAIARYHLGPGVGRGFDYDGDGKTDISVFRPSTGDWYLQQSTAGFQGTNFGTSSDVIAPADYDGDGRSDIAVYRPSAGIWYVIHSSSGTVSYHLFGNAEDLPTPADYDGDGKADISVFRPSTQTWYGTNSSDGSFTAVQFGSQGDRPTIGDFDGDGKADVAVFRPSTGAWYQLNSGDGSVFGEQFGNSTDKIAPADYDGDGKTDIGIYRPSEGLWYYKNSSNGTYAPYVFGLADDIPVAGDYDGDGKADIGVFRPSDGYWYIVDSSNGSFTILPWGQNGDIPTPNAFGN